MENNFIQVTASAGYAVAYTMGLIFKHKTQLCVQLYSTYLWRHATNNSPTVSNRSSKAGRKISAHSAFLLKPNVANILLFNFCSQCPITIVIDCNGLSLLIFEEKWLVLGTSAFQCMRAGFLCPKCDNFACLHTSQNQNELHLKRWFFCQNRNLLSQYFPALFKRIHNHIRSAEG